MSPILSGTLCDDLIIIEESLKLCTSEFTWKATPTRWAGPGRNSINNAFFSVQCWHTFIQINKCSILTDEFSGDKIIYVQICRTIYRTLLQTNV